jgi:hypothetical protein
VRDTDAVLDLGSGSGKVCYIAAQVVGLFGSRAALNYMIVSDAGKPFEMDDRPTESGALVLKASLGRSHPFARRSDHHLPKAPIERVKIGRRSWVSFGRRLTAPDCCAHCGLPWVAVSETVRCGDGEPL